MKICKISYLFLSISIFALTTNLRAMEQTEEKEVVVLLNKIEEYAKKNPQKIQALKSEIDPKAPDKLFALCLMLEEEIETESASNIQALNLIVKFPAFFENFINTNQLKHLLYWLLNYASCNDQTHDINIICQKFSELFETSIFSINAQGNYELLKMLIQENHIDALCTLINKKILKWTHNNPELRTLAQKKNWEAIEDVLTHQIRDDRIEMCFNLTLIAACFSTFFIPYLFFASNN